MKFTDSELQMFYERAIPLMASLPEDLRPVCALMDAFGWFSVIEGEETPRVREVMERLMAPELRPALRRWYQYYGGDMNPAAIAFREHLSQLTGERFG